MKILSINQKTGDCRLKINTAEDIWHLSKVLENGDLITSRSTYKKKLGKEEERQKSVRKPITVTLKISKIEFNNFSLRILGNIVNSSSEDISLDEFHSIEITEGSELKISKKWRKYQIEILKNAQNNSRTPKAIICSLDDSEANFGEITSAGIHHFFHTELELTKKRYSNSSKKDLNYLASELIKTLKEKKVEILLIISPLFWKDELRKKIEEKYPNTKKILTETVSTGSEKAFREIITKKAFNKIISNAHYIKEEKEIENLLYEISINSKKAEYGLAQISKIASSGIIKKLLVEEKFLKENFEKISKIISKVEAKNGEVIIFDPKKDAGTKLRGLGGIAAILHYKIE